MRRACLCLLALAALGCQDGPRAPEAAARDTAAARPYDAYDTPAGRLLLRATPKPSAIPPCSKDSVVTIRRLPTPHSGRVETPIQAIRWSGQDVCGLSQAWTYRLETAYQRTDNPEGTFDGYDVGDLPKAALADANADGYADLWLYTNANGAVRQPFITDVWLYRPATRRYVHHKELSRVSDLALTTTPHLLVSQPNGCGSAGSCQTHLRYWLEGETLTLLSRERYDYDSTLYVRFSYRHRGRMRPERVVRFSLAQQDAARALEGENWDYRNSYYFFKPYLNLKPVTLVDLEPFAR